MSDTKTVHVGNRQVKVLTHEGGSKFFFKHLAPKARDRKKKSRKQSKRSRRANR